MHHPSSDLPSTLTTRKPLATRHPRVVAASYSLLVGAVTSLVCVLGAMLVMPTNLPAMLACAVFGSVTSGCIFGADVLTRRNLTRAQAGKLGLKVVAGAHLFFGLAVGVGGFITAGPYTLLAFATAVGVSLFFALVSATVTALVSFPVGYYAAIALFGWREKREVLHGCTLHGLGKIESRS